MKRSLSNGYEMNFRSNGMSGSVFEYLMRVISSDLGGS